MAFIMVRDRGRWDAWRDLPYNKIHTDTEIYITSVGTKEKERKGQQQLCDRRVETPRDSQNKKLLGQDRCCCRKMKMIAIRMKIIMMAIKDEEKNNRQ